MAIVRWQIFANKHVILVRYTIIVDVKITVNKHYGLSAKQAEKAHLDLIFGSAQNHVTFFT
jgi:hypothetical protein